MVPYRALDCQTKEGSQDDDDQRQYLEEWMMAWDAKGRELEQARDDLFSQLARIHEEQRERLLREIACLRQENRDLRAIICAVRQGACSPFSARSCPKDKDNGLFQPVEHISNGKTASDSLLACSSRNTAQESEDGVLFGGEWIPLLAGSED